MEPGCAVGIATGYGLEDREVGVQVPVGSRFLSSPRRPDRLTTQLIPGALSPRVKRPVRKADHSDPTSVEVKKIWIYTTTLPPPPFPSLHYVLNFLRKGTTLNVYLLLYSNF
jgi:hypothetical protein